MRTSNDQVLALYHQQQLLGVEPEWAGMFRFAANIVKDEIPRDKGQAFLVGMLEFGERLCCRPIPPEDFLIVDLLFLPTYIANELKKEAELIGSIGAFAHALGLRYLKSFKYEREFGIDIPIDQPVEGTAGMK